MHRIHQIAEQMPNEPGTTWREVIVGTYIGMLPRSMCEVPYLLTAEFDSANEVTGTETELAGMLSYSTNVTFCYQAVFTATIRAEDNAICITETEGKPEERYTYQGHISLNGRLISLTASWANIHCPETFYLVHEDAIARAMEEENA